MDIQPILPIQPIQNFQPPPNIESYHDIWISIGCKINENPKQTSYQMIPEYIRQSSTPSLVILVDNFVGNQNNIEYIQTLREEYPSVCICIADTNMNKTVETLMKFLESMIKINQQIFQTAQKSAVEKSSSVNSTEESTECNSVEIFNNIKICNFIRFQNTEDELNHLEGKFYRKLQYNLFKFVIDNNAHKYIYNWFGYCSNKWFCNFIYPISLKFKETVLAINRNLFIDPPNNNIFFTIDEIKNKIENASTLKIKNNLTSIFTGCISLVEIPPEILPTTTAGGGHKQFTHRKTRRRKIKIPKKPKRRRYTLLKTRKMKYTIEK